MKPAILLFCCCLFAFGQSTSPTSETKSQTPASSSDQKPKDNDYGLGIGAHGRQLGALGILSDTQGVDFGPYLKDLQEQVKENWYRLIPESAEMKKGKLAIEFAITPDGKVADMRLVASSGDVGLDRPAWGSITQSNPFPPLPAEFKGPYLALRFRFFYNPDKIDLQLNDTSTDDKRSGAQFGSFDGSWEGDLTFLQGGTLSQKEQTTNRYRISIQGTKVRVFDLRPEGAREIKPGKFHIDLLMTNAIIYATESGRDHEGTWVETWVFTLTQFDRDTLLTNFSRMVNNLDLPLTSDHSKFAKEAAGKLSRISDDKAGMILGSGAGTADLRRETHQGVAASGFSARYPWYVQVIQRKVAENWMRYEVDPGITTAQRVYITFDVARDGHPSNARIEQSSGVPSLDISAVRALQHIDTFGPLPADFPDNKISVEYWFDYKPNIADNKTSTEAPPSLGGAAPSQSFAVVGISAPNDLQVPAGGAEIMRVTVTGARDKSVEWIVSGSGCAGPACGKIVDGVYIAPIVRPNPPVVTLTALSKADPTKTVSITVHIVQPAAQASSKP
jgi:TonB family protein